ncbi:MAG: hypothetical protein IJQ53_03310 [Clostridia bacterium]|nr:hypothetical protein [Clostridia bacterium]
MKKLIPATVMLLVAAILMSTASFAWFSMNNTVRVTGMEIKTKVSSNLMIAGDTLASTAKINDEYFTGEDLVQVVKGILEPVSTQNAIDFFYTTDAKATGEKNKPVSSEAFIQYVSGAAASNAAYTDKFSEVYGVTATGANAMISGQDKAVPYVDYVFQLKATNTNQSGDQYINVTKLNLQYMGSGDTTTAHRAAFFVKDITSTAPAGGPEGSSATYAVTSSANFGGNIVNGTGSYDTAVYGGFANSLATVPANTTKYYKVVVRFWLEGQDTTCNNDTFMPLNDLWKLGIELKLEDTKTSNQTEITKIGSSAALLG